MIADRVSVVVGFEGEMRFGTRSSSTGTANELNMVVVGPHSEVTVAEHDRRLYGMSVSIDPWAAFVLFGRPMYHLANSVLKASDLLDAQALRLRRALDLAQSWRERFALLEELFVRRFANGPRCSPSVVRAWRELARTGGAIAVEELASSVGWCRRNLERRFREQIGLSPKAVARTLRVRRACRLLHDGASTADVALLCGYYDQAHFVHDFKRLTGHTPGDHAPDNIEQYPAVVAGLIT